MTTRADVRSPTPSRLLVPRLLALVLAPVLAFLAGRASVVSAHGHPTPALPQQEARPAVRPPWADQGFRDAEAVGDTCLSPDCNG